MSIGKIAQKRSLRDNLRETFDISTRTLSLFDKQFADYMGRLREADNFSRKEAFKLKPTLKEASTLLNGMDYIGAASKLTNFYEILENILKSFDTLTGELANEGHKLLIDHLDQGTKENIVKYFRRPKKKASQEDQLIKNAGIIDWFSGKFKARQRALKALEKRVPKLKLLKGAVKSEISNAEALLNVILKQFDLLSKARAKGDINAYHNTITEMSKIIAPNRVKFDKFYDDSLGPYAAYIEKIMAEQTAEEKPAAEEEPAAPALEELTQPVSERINDESQSVPAEAVSHPTVMPSAPSMSPAHVFQTAPISAPPGPASTGRFVNPHVFENKPKAPSMAPPASGTQPVASKPQPAVSQKPKEDKRSVNGPRDAKGNPLPTKPPGRASNSAWDHYASSHEEFITKLASVEDSDLGALANEILAYSESLEDSDPVASLKLLAIAEGLIEN